MMTIGRGSALGSCPDMKLSSSNARCELVLTMFDRLSQLLLQPFQRNNPEDINARVEIYTWQTCPYCIRAKLLLKWKRVKYIEYKIDGDGAARVKMAARANGRKSVPQIFINDAHIGGCDELFALDGSGKLDPLLMSVSAE